MRQISKEFEDGNVKYIHSPKERDQKLCPIFLYFYTEFSGPKKKSYRRNFLMERHWKKEKKGDKKFQQPGENDGIFHYCQVFEFMNIF